VSFGTNVCSAAEYTYRSADGSDVGNHRSAGYPSAATCYNQHYAQLGTAGWTNPLRPGTAYTVTVHVVANNGTEDEKVVSFTTDAPPPVAIQNAAVTVTSSTTATVSFTTTVCAAADYQYSSADGTSTGRHSSTGYPSPATCYTDHQALLGTWTPALKPATAYTVNITVVAQGGSRATAQLSFGTP
jgi:hypothetical protein